jgi:hypothetical protein
MLRQLVKTMKENEQKSDDRLSPKQNNKYYNQPLYFPGSPYTPVKSENKRMYNIDLELKK